jgi:hypothetical protein
METTRPPTAPCAPVSQLLAPLDAIVARSRTLRVHRHAVFQSEGREYAIPCYQFTGPDSGADATAIGLFAGVHGDEPEGIEAMVRFLGELATAPALGRGYVLYAYPACNPTGLEDGTRHCRGGGDLNRMFWTGASRPEVRLLEGELRRQAFQGLIALHTDDTSHGFYSYVGGRMLTHYLIEPALEAAERLLPRNRAGLIDGFVADNGVIGQWFPGVLSAPPEAQPKPFEIVLETPHAQVEPRGPDALVAALCSILDEYRRLMAYAVNL